ncbi:phosphoprotein [Wufeng Apodemus chevrieri jeilongvirus 1]|uniref:Phosphoprotein n=1 Tax=Wufeng Apodemus chevrieri jeilongvirus 1 TaxID=2928987 RepID=A0A8T9KMI5_9MONO|nr:phosphoprotein [Wufeng Apodemus chevrieri jeilongvirus 1]
MTDYNILELERLVQDGIKTVEYLQQNPEEFQKTYGRSAIQKPSTRERIQAWEGATINQNLHAQQPNRVEGSGKGISQEQSSGDHQVDRRDGTNSSDNGLLTASREEASYQQGGNVKNPPGDNSRAGGDAQSGSEQAGTRGNFEPSGSNEPPGYHPDGRVTAEDMRQLMVVDHESSATEEGHGPVPTMTLRNATQEDFEQVFNEGAPKEHRRLRGITTMTQTSGLSGKQQGPVKKGTGGSTASTLLGVVPSSGSGAIQNVHPSLLLQPSSNASAEDAQISVPDVSTTWSTTESNKAACNCQIVEGKVDMILATLESINRKLDLIPEIKEEIKNINKKITNLSLGLSTVESYIKSMMIIIPGSGQKSQTSETEVNPDLRAVIGRDRTRGLPEVTEQRSNLESLDTTGMGTPVVSKGFITSDLDFSKSNASNFVPSEDTPSYYTIVAMIKSEVNDKQTQTALIKWLDESMSEMPMKDIYSLIRSSLDETRDSTDEFDE